MKNALININITRRARKCPLCGNECKEGFALFHWRLKSEDSATRERFDAVWVSIVKPTADELGMNSKNAVAVGSVQIMPGVVRDLLASHVVVADITGENTSVGYEIGIAHSHTKCVILMKQDGWKCGFDLQGINHICYSLDANGKRKAKKELAEHLRHCEKSEWASLDNPVMHALAPAAAALTPEYTSGVPSVYRSLSNPAMSDTADLFSPERAYSEAIYALAKSSNSSKSGPQ